MNNKMGIHKVLTRIEMRMRTGYGKIKKFSQQNLRMMIQDNCNKVNW